MRLFDKWTLNQRLAIVGCLLLMTVVAALYYFITRGFSKDIAFATFERYGNEYQQPLEQLLEHIPEHAALVRRHLKGQQVQSEVAAAESHIDEALSQVEAVNDRLGQSLQFTAEGLAKRKREHFRSETLLKEWNAVKTGQGLSLEDSDKQHEHLVADVRTMIAHSGDTSNLILDPDLDSYYLMDITLLALPQTQDRLASIAKLGSELLASPEITAAQRQQLAVAAALLKEADLDRVNADIQTSLNEDPNNYGVSESLQKNLPLSAESYQKATVELLDLMRQVSSGSGSVKGDQFSSAVSCARKTSFELWRVSSQELDSLLQQRIRALGSGRLWGLVLTALSLMASAGIAVVVIRSTTSFLGQLAEQVLANATDVTGAAGNVASAAQELAEGSSRQAALLAETSSSSQEMNHRTNQGAESSEAASRMVMEASQSIGRAESGLLQMVTSMEEIAASSHDISKVIRVIDEIAIQTNILALNAAVEAARAGDAGASFKVVADEVRGLAQRCAEAAKSTEALISRAITKAGEGKSRLDQVVNEVHTTLQNATSLGNLVQKVDESCHQQAAGVGALTDSMKRIKLETQKTAAASRRTAAASEQLNTQSTELRGIVISLNGLIRGA